MSNKKTVVITYAHLPEVSELKNLTEKTNYRENIHILQWNHRFDFPSLPHSTDLIMNVGFAGMLNPNFEMEEVYLINKVARHTDDEIIFYSDLDSMAINFSYQPKIKTAALLTSKTPIVDQLVRDKLYRSTGADLVDMETYFLYERAINERINFMSLKIVSDLADENTYKSVKEKTVRLSAKLGQIAFNYLEFYFNESNSCNSGL